MNRTARIALLLAIMIAAVVFAPAYMSHLLGGLAAGFIGLGVAAFLILAAGGAIVLSAAGILTGFLAICILLLLVLSPVLLPVALLGGFVWLIVRMSARRNPPSAAPPATPAPAG